MSEAQWLKLLHRVLTSFQREERRKEHVRGVLPVFTRGESRIKFLQFLHHKKLQLKNAKVPFRFSKHRARQKMLWSVHTHSKWHQSSAWLKNNYRHGNNKSNTPWQAQCLFGKWRCTHCYYMCQSYGVTHRDHSAWLTCYLCYWNTTEHYEMSQLILFTWETFFFPKKWLAAKTQQHSLPHSQLINVSSQKHSRTFLQHGLNTHRSMLTTLEAFGSN